MTINPLQGYNLDNFEASFREFLISENVAPITLKNYLSDLRHFLGWFTLHISSLPNVIVSERHNNAYEMLATLDSSTLSEYKNYLETNSIPVKTINRRLSTVRKFCHLCVSQGWLKDNPAKGLTNAGTGVTPVLHQSPRMQVEIEHNDNVEGVSLDSPKHLFEYEKTLTNLPANDMQMILQDIKEFFTITNLLKTV